MFLVSVTSALAQEEKGENYKYNHGKLVEENFNFKLEYVENIKSNKLAKDIFTNCYNHGRGRIYIDSNKCPEINKPAKVTLKNTGIPFSNARVYKDGKVYAIPTLEGGTTYSFLATGFSEYTIEDSSWTGTHTFTQEKNGNLEKDSDYKIWGKWNTTSVGGIASDDSTEENNLSEENAPEWFPENPRNYSLHGENDGGYLTTPLTADLTFNESDSEFTISVWHKTDTSAFAYQWLYSQVAVSTFGDGKSAILMSPWLGDDFKFSISNTTTNGEQDVIVTSTNFLKPNEWHHYVGRMNTTHLELFIDGISAGSTARTRSPHNQGNVRLGSGGSLYYLYGNMDENQVYDFWMDNEQILELYENHTVIGDSPILHYEYDGTETTTISDVSGNGHTATVVSNIEPRRGGISLEQGSYTFDGVADYLEVATPSSLLIQGDVSSFGWVKPFNTPTSDSQALFGMVTEGETTADNIPYLLTIGTSNKITYTHETGSGTNVERESTATLPINEWSHIGFTRDNSTRNLTIYINGVKDSSHTWTQINETIGGTTTDFIVANNVGWSPDRFFNGTISEVTVNGRTFTSSEVVELYNSQQNLLYINEGIYQSEELSSINYDPQIEHNVWHNITFQGICTNILQVDYRAGECGNLPIIFTSATWDESSCTAHFSGNKEGNCSQIEIVGDSSTTETFSLINYTYTNNRYYLPNATNISIIGGDNLTDDIIVGSAYYTLNDSDSGDIYYRWFVNDVFVLEEEITGLENGDYTNATLPGSSQYYEKDDVVYAIIIAENTYVNSTPIQTDNIITGNADFSLAKVNPTTDNLTLKVPNSYKFKVSTSDLDGDAVVTWAVNGNDITTGKTFSFNTNDYFVGVNTLTATATDSEFTYSESWTLTTEETDMTLAMVIAISIFAFLMLYFAFNLEQDHFLLKLLLIFVSLISLSIVPAIFNVGAANVSDNFSKLTLWLFRLFITYFSIYIFYHWVKRSEKWAIWVEKLK